MLSLGLPNICKNLCVSSNRDALLKSETYMTLDIKNFRIKFDVVETVFFIYK